MNANWQDLAAIATVLLAGAYLVRQTWLVLYRRQKSGCGGCPKCPSDAANNPLTIITIDDRTKASNKH
jgi:hypothetical protein